jgi:hypothetical protein
MTVSNKSLLIIFSILAVILQFIIICHLFKKIFFRSADVLPTPIIPISYNDNFEEEKVADDNFNI